MELRAPLNKWRLSQILDSFAISSCRLAVGVSVFHASVVITKVKRGHGPRPPCRFFARSESQTSPIKSDSGGSECGLVGNSAGR